jgi:hypothetical protein
MSATSVAAVEYEQSTVVLFGVIPEQAADNVENGPHNAKSTSIGTPAFVYWLIVMEIGPEVATFKYIHMGFGVENKHP